MNPVSIGRLRSSAWDGSACVAFARRSVERLATPCVEAGVAQTLELVVYRPLQGAARYPALVFHHGSTGNGDDASQFRITFESQSVAREFTARGWQVLFPQRRWRGQSDGVYDEGFEADRSRDACTAALARALDGAAVIAAQVAARADVDAVALNRGPEAEAGMLDLPALWLYGENDLFYSVTHSRANFDAFVAAGGAGDWALFRRADPAASVHLLHTEPGLWSAAVAAYLAR